VFSNRLCDLLHAVSKAKPGQARKMLLQAADEHAKRVRREEASHFATERRFCSWTL
jgi:hypothetical protein